nr:integrase, catalytic region, zinc finger, CCHC-type, peptidase aspartic, catalytic [Tanacetum cinerariifolium]
MTKPYSSHHFIANCFNAGNLKMEVKKLENENVELEFQVLNYAKENDHLKTTYKNLFDSISVIRTQTKTIIDSLQQKLHDTIYENAKLRAQLFDKVSNHKDTACGKSADTKFAKQSILGKPPKIGEIHDLSKPVTSNSIPTPQKSKVVKNVNVIAPGMFRINPFKPSREEHQVPNKVRASTRTKPITISQPPIITKKVVNSNANGLSSTGVDNTKTRRPQPRSNTKNDRLSSASKNSRSKNKEAENVKSKVVCAMCKQCLISVNHDVCLLNYVNVMNSRAKKQKANVSINENQKKQKPKVKKTKKVGSIERLASSKTSTPRSLLRLFQAYDRKSKASHKFRLEVFGNWQFCDLDLEVAFRRNACFIRNIEGVDLLKGDRTTNLYTINLHEMASASPICLMARTSSTKSWLWHQRLSHLNFDTINDLTKNDLVSGLSKFKYHKEHLCPSSIATACFTQNRSIIHHHFNKTPYELINGRKPDISFLYVFGALCYPKNDREDIGKLGAKGDIGFFIGYSADSCAYRVYNRRTMKIMKTMNVSFNELSAMAFEQHTTPTPTNSSSQASISPNTSQDVDELNSQQQHVQQQGNQDPIQPETVVDNVPNAMFNANTFVNTFATLSTSAAESASSQYVDPSNMHTFYQPYPHEFQWIKDHPLEQVIGEPSRPVLTKNQLRSDGDMCMYALTASTMELKNVKEVMTDPAWIKSMQEELLQFKRLDVWVLVPTLDNITPLTLKWLFKNKHDEEQTVIQNRSRLVVRGYRQEEGIDLEESFTSNHFFKGTTDPTLFIRHFIDDILVNHFFKGTTDPTLFIRRFIDDILVSNYVLEILKKYGMESCDPVGTPIEIKDKPDLDQNGTPVDATKYRSIIGA